MISTKTKTKKGKLAKEIKHEISENVEPVPKNIITKDDEVTVTTSACRHRHHGKINNIRNK